MKKKVLILGGSSDIGLELANLLINKDNYNVNLHYNSNYKAVKKIDKSCNLIKADLSDYNYKDILKKFDNDYDIIINLVGFINGKSFEQFKIESLEKTLRINSFIPLLIIRMSIKKMIKKKWGRILNSSSVGVKFGGGKRAHAWGGKSRQEHLGFLSRLGSSHGLCMYALAKIMDLE